jgi:hypothetical protein
MNRTNWTRIKRIKHELDELKPKLTNTNVPRIARINHEWVICENSK